MTTFLYVRRAAKQGVGPHLMICRILLLGRIKAGWAMHYALQPYCEGAGASRDIGGAGALVGGVGRCGGPAGGCRAGIAGLQLGCLGGPLRGHAPFIELPITH